MQILQVVLYNSRGEQRRIDFSPGALNVVTGVSGTGKSALLHIVEYCLGRDHPTVPVGAITSTVEWYGLLVQFPSVRAFVGRPRPKAGAASTSRAMLEVGANLSVPSYADLAENTDTSALREQLGRMLGTGEYRHELPAGALRQPLQAGLGQSALLCFQGQGEIANQGVLFHRQNEEGIAQGLRETLPYFIGAVAADQALIRMRLMAASRDLRRAEADLANAQRYAEGVDTQIQALVEEAYANGLLVQREFRGRQAAFEALQAAVALRSPAALDDDSQLAGRRRELESSRVPLRQELREIADQRALLQEQEQVEGGFQLAVEGQVSRLRAVDLVPATRRLADGDACPVCGSNLPDPDPTVGQLGDALARLRNQLDGVPAVQPRREATLRELEARAETARQRLRALDSALAELASGDRLSIAAVDQAQEQAFRRGRIAASLERLSPGDNSVSRRQSLYEQAQREVAGLQEQLDPDGEREEIASRLRIIGDDMTTWARDRLALEHATGSIRLDLNRLTVVADTDQGPVPLTRVGSAENWVGYHLVSHLALHSYLVRQDRPVPRFLMIDQPTQAYYPSEREQETGQFESEDDRIAVRRLFALIHDVAQSLSPDFQIIVCDHANLDEDWFQESVRHNFRRGVKLIPDSWLQFSSDEEEDD